ncbi:MAG TPA: porin [Verrucomicrobiae bacterium]
MHKQLWVLAMVLSIGFSPKVVAADERSDEINALKKQIQELSDKVQALEHKEPPTTNSLGTRNAEASAGKGTPRVFAGAEGFGFVSADTNFSLTLKASVQADGRFYVGDHIPANDTFLLRRVRPTFEGTVFKNFDYRIMLDFGANTSSSSGNVNNNGMLQEAYLNFHYWPEFQIQAGKFKPPVGLERLQSDVNYLFVERGYPTQLVPNRDVGIQIQGDLWHGFVSYQAGVFNGTQDNGQNDIDSGVDDHKDVAARVFLQPFINTEIQPLRGLGFGVAGTYGDQNGALRSYVTPGQQTFFSYRTGTGNTFTNVSAGGEHWRLVPQAYYYWGPFGMFGEYAISSQNVRRDVKTSTTSSKQIVRARNTAWQVAGSYVLTGEQNSWRGVRPRNPFNLSEGALGAWELVGRVGSLHMDSDLFPLFATSASGRREFSWGTGVNWYVNRNIKLSCDYERTAFTGGSRTAGSVTARPEQIIFTRAQIAF